MTENVSEGTDMVNVAIATASGTYILAANIENASLVNSVSFNLTGNELNNTLIGNAANNTLHGGIGHDTLDGGAGINTLTGGAGQDVFRFSSAGSTNRITDFVVIDDTIHLNKTVFNSLVLDGVLNAASFKVGAFNSAADADDYIIYNNLTGALYYDAGGNTAGSAAVVQIASLSAGLSLTNQDFVVI